jgi:pimeloyl-ACP methyl ester carboxylesterase
VSQAARDLGPSLLFVHGLWMTGLEAALLRQRLARAGFDAHQYHYPTLLGETGRIVRELDARVRALAAASGAAVHLVGHSLGGLLLLQLLAQEPTLPVGRVVLLGAPVNGSGAARGFASLPGFASVLGGLGQAQLVAPAARRYAGACELGVIAGTLPIGLGRLIGGLEGPNDGTVTVDEARLEGAKAMLTLRVSHMGLLLSQAVAANVAAFLSNGRFLPRPPR